MSFTVESIQTSAASILIFYLKTDITHWPATPGAPFYLGVVTLSTLLEGKRRWTVVLERKVKSVPIIFFKAY